MTEDTAPSMSRIQRKNRDIILDGALNVFSVHGLKGTTLDAIAEAAQMSKPNLLYYFASKDDIYRTLLTQLLSIWLDPLRQLDSHAEPLKEVLRYVRAKLAMSRDYPRESRLFANEVLQGAPHLNEILSGELRKLVDDAVCTFGKWMDDGQLARVDPHHLIFSIWALTQHYADFDVQIRAVLGDEREPIVEAEVFLENLYRQMLVP